MALVYTSTITHSFAHCHVKQQQDTLPLSVCEDQEDGLWVADLSTRLQTSSLELEGTLTEYNTADN